MILGGVQDENLLQSSMRDLKNAGFEVSHEGSLDSDGALRFFRENARDTLCVIPSPADNHPYTLWRRH